MTALRSFLVLLGSATLVLGADAPVARKTPPRMPPPGIAIPPDVKAELEGGVKALGKEIEELKALPAALELLPDVQIYYNAVSYALAENIFYRTNEFADARKLLTEGRERAAALRLGQAPWNTAPGLIVRGYVSRIDGSVQPYGILVPASYDAGAATKYRLDFWYHGRGVNLSELSFITDRETKTGEFAPPDTLVLHPYGRYCNANKFAGEVDTFEAWDNAKKHYHLDEDRVSVRGFSMGGAATWHMAAHHAGLWAAANPGAGFVDTAIFQKLYDNPRHPLPSWYEQKLWHLYDVTDYAANLFNCPVVAYSGEIDGQKQAADLMGRAMVAEGMELVHIIGPNTPHRYEAKAKLEVARRMDELAAKGRDPLPMKVRFTTWTLRYNQQDWVTVDGLERHWNRARVEAEILDAKRVQVGTSNVNALTLSMAAGLCPLVAGSAPVVVLDGQELKGPAVAADHSWTAHFEKQAFGWELVDEVSDGGLRKRHGLQGPIDDAFMDSFLIVRASGKALNDRVDQWTEKGMKDAVAQWRLQFRGEPRVKFDFAVTDEDIANHNLILWGDPRSNEILGRIAHKLPLQWDGKNVRVGPKTYSAANNVPVMIYPNPLNPARYIVVNSGFTFADEASTSNALQIPKLPDYAVLDMDAADHVVAAGFFDEKWELSAVQ